MFIEITPLSITTIFLKDLGNPATQTYLNVWNTDTRIKANVVVKVL
jgi:hypothetical protein